MNCKWCKKPLTEAQIYQYLRGKSSGNACGQSCANNYRIYGSPELKEIAQKKVCVVCGKDYSSVSKERVVCSIKCQSVLSSRRMTENNPMQYEWIRKKSSESQRRNKVKPILQGGNGRGATKQQLALYNEISKLDNSFSMEYIQKTGKYREQFKSPTHYKIDIASSFHKLAIEVDGESHNSLKVKECDKRKTEVLSLLGWRVLRLSNSQIDTELANCVQMVMSMIWK